METAIRLSVILLGVLLIAGCTSSMVVLEDTNRNHTISKSLTQEQVKEAIVRGAEFASWELQDQGPGTMQATYKSRSHIVRIQIEYSQSSYNLYYKSSKKMKMHCSKEAADAKQKVKISGRQDCPDDKPPYSIHAAYKTWVDKLKGGIQYALTTM